MTIRGANGYTAKGQVQLFSGNNYDQDCNRDQLYYQSDYSFSRISSRCSAFAMTMSAGLSTTTVRSIDYDTSTRRSSARTSNTTCSSRASSGTGCSTRQAERWRRTISMGSRERRGWG